jgi:hypothetical protein
MVSSSNIYMEQAQLDIQYNTTQFGTSIVSNQTVEVTRGANFNTTTHT